ncbi:MAG: PH domain-containing protein [Solirubrobacterales bacterium]
MSLNLGAGETVVFEGHPSWRAILDFYIKGIALVAVIFALLLWLVDSTAIAVLVLIGGSALVVLIGFIRRVSTDYMITTRRLYIKHGIISRDVQETKIERVQDVNYRQSFLQRMLQIGDVDFDTAAQDSDGDFVFAGVAHPAQVTDRVHHATEPAAQRHARDTTSSGLGDYRSDDPPPPPPPS